MMIGKNLTTAQERRLSYDKKLKTMETKHMKEEERVNLGKKFHVRQTYQIALNKRVNEQLREYQMMELTHAKEIFEVEMSGFEEAGALQVNQSFRLSELDIRQVDEHQKEKCVTLIANEGEKLQKLQRSHARLLKIMASEQRITYRQRKIKLGQM